MTATRTPPHLATLILLPGFSVLTLNMFLPSLANIAADLNADYATVSFAVAGYLAVTAVIQIVVGPLSDRIGRRPVLLVALVSFLIASVACSLAQDVGTFLVFRMLQGGIIAGSVISMAIVRDTRSERSSASLIGYISMTMAKAPMLGPVLGGILDATFGWRANFYFYALFGSMLLILCWVDLGETKPGQGTQDGLSRGNLRGLVTAPLFWAYSLCTTFSTGAFFIFLTGAPLVAASTFGVSTAKLGFFIGSITAGFIFGSFLSGRFATRVDLTSLILAGRLTACIGLGIGLAVMMAGYVTPLIFFGSTIFVGIGNGLTMPSSNAGAMSVKPKLAGSASGLNGAMIVGGGAVLTTLTGQLMPEDGGAVVLNLLMLMSSAAGLAAVLWARWLKSQERD